MSDKLMRCQVTIPLDSGIPEDQLVNTWYFDGDDAEVGDAAYHSAVVTMLTNFYTQIDGVIFPSTVATPLKAKIYDMRDPMPRLPEHEFDINVTPSTHEPLPNEVALCLSFAAAAGSGLNMKRRRGRVYIGPICFDASEVVGSQRRPTAAAMEAITDVANTVLSGIDLGSGPPPNSVKWAVYSPTTDATSSIDDAFNDVVRGWVDNAFDTQRRRGCAPTLRSTFS